MLSRAKRRQTLGSLSTNHGTPGKPSAAKRPSRKSMGSRRSMAGLGTTPSHRRKSRGPRISQYGTAAGRSRHSSTAAGFQQSGTEGVAAIATPSGGLLSGTAASRARKKAPSKKDGKTMRSSSRAAQFARSSVRTMAASQAKDKRRTQIASKVYQKESKRLIIQFLAKNNYPGEISPKTFLKHNSQREFFAIIELFFKKIDHSMHFGCSPDVVITTLKNLGYQDAISKSDLQAIGTQHTMPRILAVLRWLVQLLEYDHVIEIGKDAMERSGFGEEEQDEIVAEDEDDREVKRFLRMTSLSYMSYMQGDDEAHEEQEVQMVEYYENAEREANEELAQRREANELLRLELAELESGTSSLEVLEKRAANLDSDERDLIQYARELDGRTERKQGDCERKQVALDLQAAAFDVARATASELTHRVSQQALSAGDIKRLRATRTELRTTLALLQEQCEDLTRIQYEDDRTLQSSIQAFEAHIRDYNNDAAELELLGLADLDSTSTDPLMRCMQEARVPTELSGEQGLWAALERSRRTQSAQSAERPPFNVDFRGTARLALRKFISDAKQRSKAFQKSIAGLPHDEVGTKDLLDALNGELLRVTQVKAALEGEAAQRVKDAQYESEQHERDVAERNASIMLIDATGGVHELRAVQEENSAVLAELAVFSQQRCEAEKARDNQVVVFLQRLAAHKEKVDEVLERLHAHIAAQCEVIAADPVPAIDTTAESNAAVVPEAK